MFAKTILTSICVLAIALVGPVLADDDDDDDDDRKRSRVVKCDKGRSLQKRLDRAKDGATIKVRGVCEESVTIEKNRITLECKLGGGITGRTSTTGVFVFGQGVTITGCDISAASNGITVLRNGSATIIDNTVASGSTGVGTTQGAYARILDNTISSRTGVRANGNSTMDLARNIINATSTGIFVSNGSVVDIVGNTVTGPGKTRTGLFIARLGVVNLSDDFSLGSDPNIIQGFGTAIDCRSGSVIRSGALQDDGAGNEFTNLFDDGTCHLDLPDSANDDGFIPAPAPPA